MDEMKSAHLRNLPKAGLTTCDFENWVLLWPKNQNDIRSDFLRFFRKQWKKSGSFPSTKYRNKSARFHCCDNNLNTVPRNLWLRYSTGIHEPTCHETYMLIVCNGDLAHIYSNNCSLSEFPWRHFHCVDPSFEHGLWLHWILHTKCILDWKWGKIKNFQ